MQVGLRADDVWIIAVELSDASSREFGVALTQAEAAELKRRPVVYDAVAKVVRSYGESQPSWAGLFIDQTHGGTVVAQFTDEPERHLAALHAVIQPEARLEVRQVHWRLGELQALADRISADRAWLKNIPAVLRGSGVDISANRVVVRLSSRNNSVAELIAVHFDAAGMLDVRSDGTGALLLPWGTLVVRARDPSNRPVRGLMCRPVPDIAGAYDDASTYGTDRMGVCRIPARAGGYEVRLETQRADGEWSVVGRGRTVVPADGIGTVVIQVAKSS